MLKLQLGLKEQKSLKTRSIGWSLELLSQQPWEIGPLPNDKKTPSCTWQDKDASPVAAVNSYQTIFRKIFGAPVIRARFA